MIKDMQEALRKLHVNSLDPSRINVCIQSDVNVLGWLGDFEPDF